MPKSLIIGYGNSLRSDDGAGYKAVTILEPELSSAEVQFIATHQLTPELSEAISRASRVLFVDASHEGGAGEICFEGILRDPYFQPGGLTHDLTPSALLELSARYFQAEPEAWLLTITGETFELGENFSPPVQAGWDEYLDRIRQMGSGFVICDLRLWHFRGCV